MSAFSNQKCRCSEKMPGRFAGKVVIVTGSSQGIGRETAKMYAEEGAKLTITGRNPKSLDVSLFFSSRILSSGNKEHLR